MDTKPSEHTFHCPWCGSELRVLSQEFNEWTMRCVNPQCEQPQWSFLISDEHNQVMGFQCDNGDAH